MKEQRTGAPVFVKVEQYKEILDVLDLVKSKIKEVRDTLNAINELKKDEDTEIAMWHSTINDIEKKIEGIDNLMFEPEQAW